MKLLDLERRGCEFSCYTEIPGKDKDEIVVYLERF